VLREWPVGRPTGEHSPRAAQLAPPSCEECRLDLPLLVGASTHSDCCATRPAFLPNHLPPRSQLQCTAVLAQQQPHNNTLMLRIALCTCITSTAGGG
jgi:hypothetical protein